MSKTLVFLSTAVSFAISALSFVSLLLHLNMTSMPNMLSILFAVILGTGFFLRFTEEKDPLFAIMAVTVLIGLASNLFFHTGGILGLLIGFVANAYLIIWAFTMRKKNMVIALLLGCAYLWVTLGVFLFTGRLIYIQYSIIRLFSLFISAIPMLAAFVEMRE
jgi:hypothetical protein